MTSECHSVYQDRPRERWRPGTATDRQLFYVPEGALTVGGDPREVQTGQVAWFDTGAGGATGNYFMRCWHSAPRTGRRAFASVPMGDTGLQPDRGGAEGHGGAWGMNAYVPRRMNIP